MFLEVPVRDGVDQPRWIRDATMEHGCWRLTLESVRGMVTVETRGNDASVEALCRALIGRIANGAAR